MMAAGLAVALLLAAYLARPRRPGPPRITVDPRPLASLAPSAPAPVEGLVPTPFRITAEATVRIAVYDATRVLRAQGEGEVRAVLPPGLYSVQFEHGGIVDREIVDHDAATELVHAGPEAPSPVPFLGATTSHASYVRCASQASRAGAPGASQLFVFLRRKEPRGEPRALPSEAITIRDVDGRPLDMVARYNAEIDDVHGYVAFSRGVAPGTYRLRAERSRREVAITVPRGRSAQVFIADTGTVRLDELRVALVPVGAAFDPAAPIWRAMESVIAALRTPGATLPAAPRRLLPDAIDDDLCFGIAAAHLLRRAGETATFEAVLERLACHADVPDIALLCSVGRAGAPAATPTAPPLFRQSLILAMTHPALDSSAIPIHSPLARAARTRLHDSVWCTWSARTWDERWIEPTIERLRGQAEPLDVADIARRLALPAATVAATLGTLDATSLVAGGEALACRHVRIPSYAIEHELGHGVRSTVFRATRLSDMRPVAVKVVPLHGVAACTRMLEALHQQRWVEHPSLLTRGARGALAGGTAVWWETELCRGSVLDGLTETDAPLAVSDACRLVLQALAGLEVLHTCGLAHGRVKPENLLLRDDGSLVLSDAALPCEATSVEATERGHAARFVPYEQVCGDPAPHPTSDVWSLAATLYFLLTLEQPRDEYGGQSAADAARDNVIVPIAVRRPDVPPALARCIDRALSVDLAVRPADASAFRAHLVALTAGPGATTLPGLAAFAGLAAFPGPGAHAPRGTQPPRAMQPPPALAGAVLARGTPVDGLRADPGDREVRETIESALAALLDRRESPLGARRTEERGGGDTHPPYRDSDAGDATETRGGIPRRAARDTEGLD